MYERLYFDVILIGMSVCGPRAARQFIFFPVLRHVQVTLRRRAAGTRQAGRCAGPPVPRLRS